MLRRGGDTSCLTSLLDIAPPGLLDTGIAELGMGWASCPLGSDEIAPSGRAIPPERGPGALAWFPVWPVTPAPPTASAKRRLDAISRRRRGSSMLMLLMLASFLVGNYWVACAP